jgi:hypothetical protein
VQAHRWDVHDDPATGRGLLIASRDPMGAESTVVYDRHGVRPVLRRDAAGLETIITYDIRLWTPVTITDPNGARRVMSYTPLGLPEAIWARGRQGETAGDPPDKPGVSFAYDLLAWTRAESPAGVTVTRRVWPAGDSAAPADEADAVVIQREYWDGSGRVLQTRTSGDPGAGVFPNCGLPETIGVEAGPVPRLPSSSAPVRVSGARLLDHADRMVETCAPYFDDGWAYARPTTAQRALPVRNTYDARGVFVGSTNPDGSRRTIVRGVAPAGDLTHPEALAPSPWEAHTYTRVTTAAVRTRP